MRNLKKILSLVLALMMVLSVMATASATDFVDDAEINADYKVAVEVLTGLKVINGVGDEFLPKDYLNREAAAKIVAYVKLGGDVDATLADALVNPFSDVKGWSENVIKYCYSEGIVDGVGDGTFLPKDYLTGYAFAKMLLVAAGIDGEYTGANWKLNIATAAQKAGFLKGLENVSLSGRLTREQACQMAWNALTYTATGSTVYNVTDGTNTYTFDNLQDAVLYKALLGAGYRVDGPIKTTAGSLADTVFGMATPVTGVVTANQATTTNKYTTMGGHNYAVETGLDLIGHNVTVYYQKAEAEPAAGYKTFAVLDNSTTFEMTAATTQDQLNAALGVAADPASYSYTKYSGNYSTSTATVSPVGTVGTAIIYDKAVIGFVEPTAYVLDKVTDVVTTAGSEAIKIYNGGSEHTMNNNATSDVVVEYEGIAKDDVIVRYKVGDIFHLSKAETITGVPTKINGTTLTIGGKDYAQDGFNRTAISATTPGFTAPVTLYLAPDGTYFVAAEPAGAPSAAPDVVYLVAKYTTTVAAGVDEFGDPIAASTSYWAQCVDMAGNQVIYQITKAVYDNAGVAASTLYKATSAEAVDDGNGNMKAVYTTLADASSASVTTEIKTTDVKIANNHYFTSDVKFIYVKGTKGDLKVTVKDGIQAVADTFSKEYIAIGTETNKTVSFVVVENAEYSAPAATPSTSIVYAAETANSTVKVPYTDAAGVTQTGYEHTVYIDGVKTTIITASATAITGFNKFTKVGDLYTVESLSAANLKDATVVTNMYNGMISTSAVADLPVAGATVINLSGNAKVPTDPAALSTADTVALVLNADLNAVVMIYVTASSR